MIIGFLKWSIWREVQGEKVSGNARCSYVIIENYWEDWGRTPPSLRPSPMQLIVLPLPRHGTCRIPYYRPNEFFCLNKTMAGSFSQCLDSKNLEKTDSRGTCCLEIIRNEELILTQITIYRGPKVRHSAGVIGREIKIMFHLL